MDIKKMTIEEARQLLDNGELSALALTEACLKNISELNPRLHAVLNISADEARAEAKEADKRLAQGEKGGLLGIPYLAKDNLMTAGLKTTAASKILENYIAPYDATVIKKLKAAGAILLGKTNLDEFAHGASTENSAYGTTFNPYDTTRVAGGSSGGSAAAVASGLCLFALGSDTGGSIRQPASFCGVVGLKPSYGRVSRFGLISMTSSTDVIGPIAKTARDAAAVLAVIAGRDDRDATTAPEVLSDYVTEAAAGSLKGLKIGLPKEYWQGGIDEKYKEAFKKLEEAGAKLVKISLPNTEYGIPVYYLITPSEISSNLARFDGIAWGHASKEAADLQSFYKMSRGQGFGPEAKRRILLGTFALSAGYYDAYYKKAQAVRTLIAEDFNKAFKSVHLIFTPTTPHPAFKAGEIKDPLSMYMEDIYLAGASLAGLPAVSVPAAWQEEEGKRLPLGGQFIGPRLKEGLVLRAARSIEDNIQCI